LRAHILACGEQHFRAPSQAGEHLTARSYKCHLRNIKRELRNVIERCVLLSSDATLDPSWLQLRALSMPPEAEAASDGDDRVCFKLDGSTSMEQIERRVLEEALKRRHGNVTQAARLLRMSRQSLRYRVEKHGLKADVRDDAPDADRG
jgi:DNA-binding NtrC family response regulator